MSNTKELYHKSVLVEEVIEHLNPQPGKTYLDATFGGGGHTQAILEHEPTCNIIALDWDPVAIEKNEPELVEKYGKRLRVIWGNFAHLDRLFKKNKITSIDGILADFGTSQHQIFKKDGFSFSEDTPLDMRMSTAHYRITAADIVNNYPEKDLAAVIYEYGEDRRSRAIARAIIDYRKKKKIKTTKQLAELIESVVPRPKGRKGIHPATRTFQALRIEVNEELINIKKFLAAGLNFLAPDGNFVCISFHSLEDRIVKHFFKDHKDSVTILTPKPVVASQAETSTNPSARSAKLRAGQKKSL